MAGAGGDPAPGTAPFTIVSGPDPDGLRAWIARTATGAGVFEPDTVIESDPGVSRVRELVQWASRSPHSGSGRVLGLVFPTGVGRPVAAALLRVTESPPAHLTVYTGVPAGAAIPAPLTSRAARVRLGRDSTPAPVPPEPRAWALAFARALTAGDHRTARASVPGASAQSCDALLAFAAESRTGSPRRFTAGELASRGDGVWLLSEITAVPTLFHRPRLGAAALVDRVVRMTVT